MIKPTLTTSQRLAIGDGVRSLALSYARMTGTEIDKVVVLSADAKHESSLAPIKLFRAIKAKLTPEQINSLPRPGSHWNDDSMYDPDGKRTNETPDVVEWKDPAKPDSKAKEISFYVTWADNTPEGARVVQELDWIARLSSENMKTDDIPAWFTKKYSSPELLKKHKKYLDSRRANVRKQYKEAVRLIWQLDMVNELDGVVATLDDDETENTVKVANKAKPDREYRFYSIGAFLKLDPLKASETDGSYAALEATAKRGVGDGEAEKNKTPGVPALHSIQTPDTLDKVALPVHLYLSSALNDRRGDMYAQLLRHLTSDGGKQSVLTLGGIYDAIGALLRIDTVRAIYDTEKQKLKDVA